MASHQPQALASTTNQQPPQLNRDLGRFWILVCRQALTESNDQWAIEVWTSFFFHSQCLRPLAYGSYVPANTHKAQRWTIRLRDAIAQITVMH